MSAIENPSDQWSQGLPEKTPNSDDQAVSKKEDLEALAAEVLDTPNDASYESEIVDAEVVPDAEVVAADVVAADVITADVVENDEASVKSYLDMPPRAYAVAAGPVDFNQRKLQTKGGAVGGVLLAALSIVGAFLTGYSVINACLGLALSAWGLNSSAKRLATIGIVLSIIGILLSTAFSFA